MGRLILASDIGGTQSRFGLFESGSGALALKKTVTLRTAEAGSFGGLLKNLTKSGISTAHAEICALGVAGPVQDGIRCFPPNIGWEIDLSDADELGIRRFVLINDFVAQAHACLSPLAQGADPVLSGEAAPGGTIAVVGAGTGFGKAALVPHSGAYAVMPSEGGHAAFPFTGEREYALAEFIRERALVPYITLDDIVTGRGFALLHEFLTGECMSAMELRLEGETLAWASRMYARAARDFALDTLATGGVYIAGGIAARSPNLVLHPEFGREFLLSAKHAALLQRIRVSLIRDELSGLWGAAHAGLVALEEGA